MSQVPVDLFADPDGAWSYESLAHAAGFDPKAEPTPVIGALSRPWNQHPDGAAVVFGTNERGSYVAIVECDAAEFASESAA